MPCLTSLADCSTLQQCLHILLKVYFFIYNVMMTDTVSSLRFAFLKLGSETGTSARMAAAVLCACTDSTRIDSPSTSLLLRRVQKRGVISSHIDADHADGVSRFSC